MAELEKLGHRYRVALRYVRPILATNREGKSGSKVAEMEGLSYFYNVQRETLSSVLS